MDRPWLLRSFGSSQSSQFNPHQLILQSVSHQFSPLAPPLKNSRESSTVFMEDRGQGKVFSWEISVVLLRLQVNEKSFLGAKEASDVIPSAATENLINEGVLL